MDRGVNRTLFRNVAEELADAFGMNHAYGVTFVDVDPITMGIGNREVSLAEQHQQRKEAADLYVEA